MSKEKFNLKIKQDICLRCGVCTVNHPDIFIFDNAGNIVVKKDAPKNDLDKIKGVCPVQAILNQD